MNERMGAGYVTGTAQETETSLSASVGGPLSTLRAEGASLLRLLLDLRDGSSTPLLVFVDCLVLLDILQRWGDACTNFLNFSEIPKFVPKSDHFSSENPSQIAISFFLLRR